MKENQTTCDPCEEMFEQNIDRIVREGEAPLAATHHTREKEVQGGFAGPSAGETQPRPADSSSESMHDDALDHAAQPSNSTDRGPM